MTIASPNTVPRPPPSTPGTKIGALYRQYKADNLRVINWLGRTALKHGFSRAGLAVKPKASANKAASNEARGDTHRGAESERTAKQLRDARKKAKQRQTRKQTGEKEDDDNSAEDKATTTASAPSSTSVPYNAATKITAKAHVEPQQYLVTARDHLAMSRHIVDSNVRIPAQVTSVLERCIRLRKRIAGYYAYTEEPVSTGHNGHEYYLTVLEDVHAILLSKSGAPFAGKAEVDLDPDASFASCSPESPSGRRLSHRNRYAALVDGEDEGDETLVDVLEMLDLEDDSKKEVIDKKEDTFDQADSHFDRWMQVIAFLEEVHEVRASIKRMWDEYKDGHVDLITVGLATNTAIDLLAERHEEVVPKMTTAFGEDVGEMLRKLAASRADAIRHSGTADSAGAEIKDNDRIAAFFLIPQWDRIYAAIQHPPFPIELADGVLADCSENKGNEGKDGQQRAGHHRKAVLPPVFANELDLLDKIVRRFAAFGAWHEVFAGLSDGKTSDTISIDATTRVMASFFGYNLRPTVLVTAVACICTDVAFLLGEQVTRPLVQLRSDTKRFERSWDDFERTNAALGPKLGVPVMKWTKRFKDALYLAIAGDGVLPTELSDHEDMLSIMPIYCGRLLAYASLLFRVLASALMHDHMAIPCTAHLYMIAKNRTAAAPGDRTLATWQDMDELARLCGKEHVYGDVNPNATKVPTLEEIRRSLHALGGFPDRLAKYSAPHSPVVHPKSQASISRRWLMTDGRSILNFYTHDVIAPADGSRVSLIGNIRDYVMAIQHEVDSLANAAFSPGMCTPLRKVQRARRMSIADVVDALVCIVEDEVPVLYFDILSFDKRCSHFLSKLHRVVVELAKKHRLDLYVLEDDSSMVKGCSPASLTLHVMEMIENIGMLVKLSTGKFRRIKTFPSISHVYMSQLRFGIKDMVEEEGTEETEAMRARMARGRKGMSGVCEIIDGEALSADPVLPEPAQRMAVLRQYVARARQAITPMPIGDALLRLG